MQIYRMGELVVELYWKHAPQTCRNFAELTRRGYFNGTKFHRIIPDFMIQGKFNYTCNLYSFKGNIELNLVIKINLNLTQLS